MPTGLKDECPSINVTRAALELAQIATSNAQVPDPDRPRQPPPPPQPKNPERDDPEHDDPQEPDQEKPPPLPPWLNQA